ncbi:MAG TPA: class I SAM-dependent methyltransferase, partial [Puia sp.]|nr:class I SAM-dependent methyltransferase [Puia sp.]
MNHGLISEQSLNTPLYMAPSAWVEHIPFAFSLIEKLRPKLIVELGVHYGVSYFSFCQAVKLNSLNATCYAVDNWKGDEHAGFYDETIFELVKTYNSEHYAEFSYLLKCNFDEALTYFEDKSIDLLHIDGLHTYEAVKYDFEAWLPKLSENAVVLFHDISVREKGFGVFRLWEELVARFPSFAFTHGYGLGVLLIGKNHSKEILSIISQNEEHNISLIRNYFHRLGSL